MTDKGIRNIVLLLLTTKLEVFEVSASRHSRSLTPLKTRYSIFRGLGGPQGRSGQVRIISPTPSYHAWTVQLVASSYIDYATWPTN